MMVPDCLLPPVGGTVRVDLRHHVSLSLGPAVDMTNWVPETHLEKSLCPSSLAKTLGLQWHDYWEELNPILEKWRSVNNTRCPECACHIRVNMARHLRLMNTTYVCFWRCPVLSCSLWFTSELNTKDHIESIHHFREGLLRVSPAVRLRVVREPGILRRTTTGVTGAVDGLGVGTPVQPGAEE